MELVDGGAPGVAAHWRRWEETVLALGRAPASPEGSPSVRGAASGMQSETRRTIMGFHPDFCDRDRVWRWLGAGVRDNAMSLAKATC